MSGRGERTGDGLPEPRGTGGRVGGDWGRVDVVWTTGCRYEAFTDGLVRGDSLDAGGSADAEGSNGLAGAVNMDAIGDGRTPAVSSFALPWWNRMVEPAMTRARAAMSPPARRIQRNADAGARRV